MYATVAPFLAHASPAGLPDNRSREAGPRRCRPRIAEESSAPRPPSGPPKWERAHHCDNFAFEPSAAASLNVKLSARTPGESGRLCQRSGLSRINTLRPPRVPTHPCYRLRKATKVIFASTVGRRPRQRPTEAAEPTFSRANILGALWNGRPPVSSFRIPGAPKFPSGPKALAPGVEDHQWLGGPAFVLRQNQNSARRNADLLRHPPRHLPTPQQPNPAIHDAPSVAEGATPRVVPSP